MTLAILVATGAGALYFVTRPQRLAGIVESAIERFTDVDASVGSAMLRWDGQLTLQRLRLSVPNLGGDTARILDVREAMLDPHLGGLLRGRLEAQAIVLRGPTLHVTESLDHGRYNFQLLPRRGDDRDFNLPDQMPEVYVDDGLLRFGEVAGGKYAALQEIPVEGTLTQTTGKRGEYTFVLRQQGMQGEEDPLVLRGQMDLGERRVRAQLERFRIDEPQKNFLPHRFREWWERMQPQGTLPQVEVAFDADQAVGLQATLVLARGGLSLPYGDLAPRLSDVEAKIVVNQETITLERLTGLFEGTRYDVSGTITGFEKDAPFSLTAKTAPFTLQDNPAWAAHLPPRLRKHYDRFAPVGTGYVEASARRAERGGPVAYGGVVRILEGTGRYFRFPYPLASVRGDIRFSDEKVDVDLAGVGPTGAKLAITGEIRPPGDGASVRLHIVATDMPVDAYLLEAMEPKHRKVMELFLNPEAYASLVERGVVRPTAEAPGDAPVFAPGGTIDAVVDVLRPYGHDVKYSTTVAIDTTGAGMVMKHWPYPLTSAGGRIVIGPERVEVEGVRARGLTGGSAIIEGTVESPGKENAPNITLRDVRLPIDEVLYASLPQTQSDWVRRLGLGGALVGQGRVFEGADGDIDFALDAELPGGELRLVDGALVLHDFTGSLTIRKEGLDLHAFTGSHGSTKLGASGAVGWADDRLAADLRVSATDLDFTPPLVRIIPDDHPARPRLDALMEKWKPTGRLSGELDYQTATATRSENFTLTLQPRSLGLDLRGQRVEFADVAGTAVVHPAHADLRSLSIPVEGGRASLSGRVDYAGEGAELALRIAAEGDGCGPQARTLLPDGVVDAIDGLRMAGRYRMQSSLVTRKRPGLPGDRELEFEGQVELLGGTADVGVPVTELTGTLSITAAKADGERWPRLDLRLDAGRLRVSDRLVQPMSLHMATTQEQPDVLVLDEMVGRVYGGTLVGSGAIELGEPGKYRFDLALESVDVDPMLTPLEVEAAGYVPPSQGTFASESGKLSASLSIEAERGKPETRRGRGALDVRDATLYEKPVTMAVLQASTLSLPTHRAFDRVGARYLVDGGAVIFDEVRFESPSVMIAGEGTMNFETLGLDLAMVTRNPTAPTLGPINDVVNAFKDEFVAIHVTGTLDAPLAQLAPLSTLRKTLNEMWGTPTPRDAAVVE